MGSRGRWLLGPSAPCSTLVVPGAPLKTGELSYQDGIFTLELNLSRLEPGDSMRNVLGCEELDPAPVGVVHHGDERASAVAEVPCGDVLPIALEVRPARTANGNATNGQSANGAAIGAHPHEQRRRHG